jgi:hypothetical protein
MSVSEIDLGGSLRRRRELALARTEGGVVFGLGIITGADGGEECAGGVLLRICSV